MPQTYVRSQEPAAFDAIVRTLWARDPAGPGRLSGLAVVGDDRFAYELRFGLTARGNRWIDARVSADGSFETLEAAAGVDPFGGLESVKSVK